MSWLALVEVVPLKPRRCYVYCTVRSNNAINSLWVNYFCTKEPACHLLGLPESKEGQAQFEAFRGYAPEGRMCFSCANQILRHRLGCTLSKQYEGTTVPCVSMPSPVHPRTRPHRLQKGCAFPTSDPMQGRSFLQSGAFASKGAISRYLPAINCSFRKGVSLVYSFYQ